MIFLLNNTSLLFLLNNAKFTNSNYKRYHKSNLDYADLLVADGSGEEYSNSIITILQTVSYAQHTVQGFIGSALLMSPQGILNYMRTRHKSDLIIYITPKNKFKQV